MEKHGDVELAMDTLMSVLQDRGVSAEDFFVYRLLFDIHSAFGFGIEESDVSLDGKEVKEAQERFVSYYSRGLNIRPLRETLLLLMEHEMINKKDLRDNLDWDNFNPASVSLNKRFLDKLWRYACVLGKELWAAYPNIGNVDGKEIPLKTIKKLSCEEELYTKYAKSIGHDPKKHKEVLSLIEWSVDNRTSFTNMSLESFVLGRIWESIKEFMDAGNTGYMNGMDDYFDYV